MLAVDAADVVDVVPQKLAVAVQQVAQGLEVAVEVDVGVVAKKLPHMLLLMNSLKDIDLFSYLG